MVCHIAEMKHYCSTLLPYVSDQPLKREQLASSLLEANALSCAVARGSEIDWSQQAPAAKRARQVTELQRLSSQKFLI